MSDAILSLIGCRQELRDSVLTAIMAPDSSSQVSAWKAVDDAAIALARERRRYDRYVKEVCRKAARAGPTS